MIAIASFREAVISRKQSLTPLLTLLNVQDVQEFRIDGEIANVGAGPALNVLAKAWYRPRAADTRSASAVHDLAADIESTIPIDQPDFEASVSGIAPGGKTSRDYWYRTSNPMPEIGDDSYFILYYITYEDVFGRTYRWPEASASNRLDFHYVDVVFEDEQDVNGDDESDVRAGLAP